MVLNKEIDAILGNFLKTEMSNLKGRSFAICADISTTKSMVSSYLGFTVHCFDKYFHNQCFALAIEELNGVHDNKLIRKVAENVLEKYGFGFDNVSAFVTDNGGNMVKAFK